ncbi:MAG TPA: diguanylate cyclase, partial [Novosphingobium sp.]|nr:diguanylate cyclase [Novosphingobium sp.]
MASLALDPAADGHDALTGLLSAAAARARLEAWAGAGARWQAMLIGLPRLQAVNHAYGHSAGDGALVEIGQRIRAFCRDEL